MPRTPPQTWPALLLLSACGQFIVGAPESQWTDNPVVVPSIDAVPDAQILDARTPEEYAEGHIGGAIGVSWTELHGFDGEGLWDAGDPDAIAAVLADRGVRFDQPAVVVGGNVAGWGDDGNLYWVLRWLGHPDVHVLDGGYSGWLAQGGAPSTGPVTGAGHAEVALDPGLYADSDAVAEWPGVVLDVRSAEEYGEGHVPGAVWLEWSDVLDEGGFLRSEADLWDELGAVGIDADAQVVTYCQAGIRAGHTFMVLEALGVDASNYVGSWARWSAEGRPAE